MIESSNMLPVSYVFIAAQPSMHSVGWKKEKSFWYSAAIKNLFIFYWTTLQLLLLLTLYLQWLRGWLDGAAVWLKNWFPDFLSCLSESLNHWCVDWPVCGITLLTLVKRCHTRWLSHWPTSFPPAVVICTRFSHHCSNCYSQWVSVS